ncbi:MAG: tetratricopeptide repeat protein [Acidobacteria bacterium]|nr:tetratricopeptide repeat protein [Acidobacteriota bacterium]
MRKRTASLVLVSGLVLLVAACATRAVAPVVTAPRHPDFMFPAPPANAAPDLASGLERGWQFLQGGDLRNAEREFGRAQRAGPASASPEAALGYVALARGVADDALPRFDRALTRDPRYVPALIGRGQTLMALQREGEALASYEAALAADPSLTDLQARVDVLRFRATQDLLTRAKTATEAGRLDEARNAYQQAVAASPDSAFLYRELAGVERQAGEVTLATEHLRRAIDLDPAEARTHAALGELLEQQDDIVGALAAFEKARSLDPSAVPPATLARARDRVAMLRMPAEYRGIAAAPRVTRADLAALIGVRLEGLVARAAPRQVVITDVRGHWAEPWISAVVRASIMDTLPNYQFDPTETVRRGDLARTVARALNLIAAIRPAAARKWENARITVSDVSPAHLAYPAVSMAVASGVMSLENGAFRLLDPVNGAEAVEAIGRLEALAR